MSKSNENMLALFKQIQLSIGDLSDGIGVSQRQLRYWEQKNYIKPIDDNERGVRRYSFPMAARCAHIKAFLDQGFTLSKAYQKAIEKEERSKVLRNFLFEHDANFDIKVNDSEQGYGEIDLNTKCEGKELFGIVDENGIRYDLRAK